MIYNWVVIRVIIHPNVESFIKDLETSTITKGLRYIDLLEKFTFNLREPYSKKIGDNMFELGIQGKQEIRIFYTFMSGEISLIHGFVKKTQKTPSSEILIAKMIIKKLTV